MTDILSWWNAILEAVAVIVVVMTALGLMIGVIEYGRAFRHLAIVLGCTVLLLRLPPIIVNIWHSLSLLQQLGMITVIGVAGVAALRGGKPRSRGKSSGR